MGTVPSDKIRNIGIFGHSGTGKTSLVEAILFASHQTTRLGNVEEGNTVTDYEPDEIKRKTTINSKLASFNYQEYKFNIFDTPGYADFIGEVLALLPAIESAVFLVSASAGVEITTKRLWRYGQESGKTGFIFVNKIEKENVEFEKVTESIKKSLSSRAQPVFLPVYAGGKLAGLADLLLQKFFAYQDGQLVEGEPPAEFKGRIEAARTELVEKVAESSEELLEKYLTHGQLTEPEFFEGLKKALHGGDLVPIFCGSASNNLALNYFLENLATLAPSPLEKPGLKALNPDTGVEEAVKPGPAFASQIFKIISDPGVGEIYFLKIFSGTARSGLDVFVPNKRSNERLGGLLTFLAKKEARSLKLAPVMLWRWPS